MRFGAFGESAVNFTVSFRAREFTDTFLIKHEFIKAVHERYRQEGIVIPFPVRTVELSEKTAAGLEHLVKNSLR